MSGPSREPDQLPDRTRDRGPHSAPAVTGTGTVRQPTSGTFAPVPVPGLVADDSMRRSPGDRRRPGNRGLPKGLRGGIESLTGLSMADVEVHYNSAKPAVLDAAAYTVGTQVYLAPGQERHLAHEAWHVVQQLQRRVATTAQLRGRSVNTDDALEAEASAMGARALTIVPGGPSPVVEHRDGGESAQPAQLMALYHGTTIENAGKILQNIDPTKGKGEFGRGFYTVFAAPQARHIAMYYWDKEGKYEVSGNTGVTVVIINIPANWWTALMKAGNEDYEVVEYTKGPFITEGAKLGKDAGEELPLSAKARKQRKDRLPWLPRQQIDRWGYAESDDRKALRGPGIMVGPIKDPQTPYQQVVFGPAMVDLLNSDEVTKKQSNWQELSKGAFGAANYAEFAESGRSVLGALGVSEAGTSKNFIALAPTLSKASDRTDLVVKYLGGFDDDIPDEVAEFFRINNVQGSSGGEQKFNYINKGMTLAQPTPGQPAIGPGAPPTPSALTPAPAATSSSSATPAPAVLPEPSTQDPVSAAELLHSVRDQPGVREFLETNKFDLGHVPGTKNSCLFESVFDGLYGAVNPSEVAAIRLRLAEAKCGSLDEMVAFDGKEWAQFANYLAKEKNVNRRIVVYQGGDRFATQEAVIGEGGDALPILHLGAHFSPLRPLK